jgi:NifU-like protein involved in Fe-S cluster formation
MVVFYRLPGLLASIALVMYVAITLSLFKLVPVTLTLAGIGGFILSIGMAVVGSPACGDMMAVWIKVDKFSNKITECKWRTFGCASAIASTSMMSVMVTENGGMSLQKAKRISPEAIIERLSGLPDRKYHCSVLGHNALREAIIDYERGN